MHFCFPIIGTVKTLALINIALVHKRFVVSGDSTVVKTTATAPKALSGHLKDDYRRNKSSNFPMEILENYCSNKCNGSQFVSLKPTEGTSEGTCPSLQCMPCNCVRPACEIYGLCCPDVSDDHPLSESGVSLSPLDSAVHYDDVTSENRRWKTPGRREYPALGCDKSSYSNHFVFIRSCPRRRFAESNETLRLCEENVPIDDITVEIITRAVDVLTGAVYRNKFCAECNGVKQISMFQPVLLCRNYMSIYQSTNPDEMLRLALKPGSYCRHIQQAPNDITLLPCTSQSFNLQVLNSCNLGVNSTSWNYDADIERACREMTSPVYQLYSTKLNLNTQNIFCAICNGAEPTYHQCVNEIPPDIIPPFYLLINYMVKWQIATPKNALNELCSGGVLDSPLNSKCIPLKCSSGKLLENGKCIPAMSTVMGLKYSLQLWLVPYLEEQNGSTINNTFTSVEGLKSKVLHVMNAASQKYSVDIISVEDNSKTAPNDETGVPLAFWIDCKFEGNTNVPREEIEELIVEKLILNKFRFDLADTTYINFKPYLMMGKLDINDYCSSSYLTSKNFTCKTVLSLPDLQLLMETKTTERYIPLRPTLTCCFVSFNKSLYDIREVDTEVPPRITVTLTLSRATVEFTDVSELNMIDITLDGVLNVCNELFEFKTQSLDCADVTLASRAVADHNISPQYILTIIFMAASMFCILLTLITYFRFKILRTMAGKNNMFLSFSLLVAQAMLLIAAHIPRHGHLCTVVGISTHFLWLWLFSWTLLCSFNMVRVFTSRVQISNRPSGSRDVHILRRFLCSLLLPACAVSIVITTSFYSTSGREIGYGAYVCYLNSPYLVGVAFICPLILIICSNIICFFITVYKIRSLRMQQTSDAIKHESYKNLFVYVKLSSMTGALWVVAVVGEAIDSNVLRFISIILNGLQGVFIFLSFTFNRRVLSLYCTQCFKERTLNLPSPTIPSSTIDVTLVETELQ